MQEPIEITGIWLRSVGMELEVLAEIDGEWKIVIRERLPGTEAPLISHIVEPAGMHKSEEVPHSSAQAAGARIRHDCAGRPSYYRRDRWTKRE